MKNVYIEQLEGKYNTKEMTGFKTTSAITFSLGTIEEAILLNCFLLGDMSYANIIILKEMLECLYNTDKTEEQGKTFGDNIKFCFIVFSLPNDSFVCLILSHLSWM